MSGARGKAQSSVLTGTQGDINDINAISPKKKVCKYLQTAVYVCSVIKNNTE